VWVLALLLAGHVYAASALLRRVVKMPVKTSLAAVLSADGAAGGLMTAAFFLGAALIQGLTRLANLAAGNSLDADFLGDAALKTGCLLGFLALRAWFVPPFLIRLAPALRLDGLPLEPRASGIRLYSKLALWSALSAAATCALLAAAWVGILGAAAARYLLGGH
jgi:hypothetical protein